MHCEHANECPQACPCDAECYCREHTCKNRLPDGQSYKPCGTSKAFHRWMGERVECNLEIMGGQPIFVGSRILVRHVGNLARRALLIPNGISDLREDYNLSFEDLAFAARFFDEFPPDFPLDALRYVILKHRQARRPTGAVEAAAAAIRYQSGADESHRDVWHAAEEQEKARKEIARKASFFDEIRLVRHRRLWTLIDDLVDAFEQGEDLPRQGR